MVELTPAENHRSTLRNVASLQQLHHVHMLHFFKVLNTSSSAVAERLCDLCPSVVSRNKIITCAESFIIVT